MGRKWLGLMLCCLAVLSGCGGEKEEEKTLREVDYTVEREAELPEELVSAIEDQKSGPFQLTYSDNENLYAAVGYGEQETGGYSISVESCRLTESGIVLDTELVGPEKGEAVNASVSYPFLVIRMEYMDQSVRFE